jgi:hypothetical protein
MYLHFYINLYLSHLHFLLAIAKMQTIYTIQAKKIFSKKCGNCNFNTSEISTEVCTKISPSMTVYLTSEVKLYFTILVG